VAAEMVGELRQRVAMAPVGSCDQQRFPGKELREGRRQLELAARHFLKARQRGSASRALCHTRETDARMQDLTPDFRLDNGHPSHADPRAQAPHIHVPGMSNPDGTPWLPAK
jgi:hypothetical protein